MKKRGTLSDLDHQKYKFLHGNIVFVLREVQYEYGQMYVRVPANVNIRDLLMFMRDVWHMECPMIVLSILTGRSTDKEWQSHRTIGAFKSAIKTAAVNTDMWVLTHGLNFGVTRMVGEAYNEEIQLRALGKSARSHKKWTKGEPSLPLVLVGICPSIMLIGSELFDGSPTVLYTIRGGIKQDTMGELDPHHTHYIIVDDYVDENDSGQILSANTLRSNLEKMMIRSKQFRVGRFTQISAQLNDNPMEIAKRRSNANALPHRGTLIDGSPRTITAAQTSSARTSLITSVPSSTTLNAASGVKFELPLGQKQPTTPHDPSFVDTTELDKNLKSQEDDKDMLRDIIPIVCLVIGGGTTTLKEIAERVYLGIPVLLCKGSGLAANILAYVHEELGDNVDMEFENKLIRPEVTRRLLNVFPSADQTTLDNCLNAVMQIINGCRMVQRTNLAKASGPQSSTNDITCSDSQFTGAVLRVFDTRNWKADPGRLHRELLLILLKCRHIKRKQQGYFSRQQVYRQLQLLLDWNAPELTQFEIFDQEDMPVYVTPVHIFEQAIVRPKREAFVELFLDRNFQIQRFFTRYRIRRWLLLNESEFFKEVCINQLLRGTDKLENYNNDDDISPLVNSIIRLLTGLVNLFNPIELRTTISNSHLVRVVTPESQVFTSLTLLAVLLNRHKLARVLLKRCDCPIPVALFASLLYKKLVHYCREPFMKEQLRRQETEMADYAVGILDMCFNTSDHCSPREILDQPHLDFSNMTTIQIAYKSKVLKFLAHPLCQRWISERYYGGLRFLDLSFGICRLSLMVKVITSATLFVPSLWWVSLDNTDEYSTSVDTTQKEVLPSPAVNVGYIADKTDSIQ